MEMAAPRGARAVLRRPAEGHDAHPVPVQHPALQGGAGARLVRVAPPRPGARRSTCWPPTRAASARVVSDVIGLDEAPDAFARIRAGEALKVVVAP